MAGWEPLYELIHLTHGDYIESLVAPFPLPPGTTAEIKWANDVVWNATVDGDTVSWRVESEDAGADVVPHRTACERWIHYPNLTTETTDDIVWKVGHAQRTPIDEE